MMAFFLLMWLLGSTSQGDLKGIADYFNAPLKVAMPGGRGAGDASSLIQGGGTDMTRRDGQVKNGDSVSVQEKRAMRAARMEAARIEAQRLTALKAKVDSAIASTPKLAEFAHQVRLDLTPDGLRIQIVDDQHRPMFDSGSAIVKPYMRDLLQNIGRLLQEMDARVTLSGHTDSKSFPNAQRGYSNWELSADRANASRRELLSGGLSEERIFRVIGLAASVPINTEDPAAPTNRRISIIVMNKEAENRLMNGAETRSASDVDDVQDALDQAAQPQVVSGAQSVSGKSSVDTLRAQPSDASSIPTLK
jgi:chemotaxis protein MotB